MKARQVGGVRAWVTGTAILSYHSASELPAASPAHEAAGHGESERRGRVAFGGEDAEVHDEQHFEERLHADADDEGGEVSERRGEEQREAHHDGDEQGRVDLEDVEAVARQRVDAGDDENEQSPAQNAECEGVLAGGQHFPWDDAAEEIAGDAGEQRDEANAEHVLEAAACSAARQEYGKGALFVLAGEGQKGSRCQGEQGRRRRRYHRRQERGDEHAQEQRDAEDRADVVDSEVRLHAGVALSPEYPERGLGDALDDDRDEVEACGREMEGKKSQGHRARRSRNHRRRQDDRVVA